MRKLTTLLLLAIISINGNAQKSYSKIKVTGFDVQFAYTGGFSYKYEKNLPVIVSDEGGTLSLTLDKNKRQGGIKPQLILNADKLTYLELSGCTWSYVGEGIARNAEINMQDHTTADLLAGGLGNMKITVGSNSELSLGGAFTTLDLDVSKGSNLTATALRADTIKLNIVSASKANMELVAKQVDIVAKYAVELVLKGETDKLNIIGNMAVRLNASALKTQKAYVDTHRGCDIVINAKEVNRNPEVMNIVDMHK